MRRDRVSSASVVQAFPLTLLLIFSHLLLFLSSSVLLSFAVSPPLLWLYFRRGLVFLSLVVAECKRIQPSTGLSLGAFSRSERAFSA